MGVMKIKMFLLFIFSTFFYFLPLDAKNPKSCKESVNILHETLIKNNNSKQNVEFRLDLIQQELKGVFDYKKMIRMIYGHDWKKLDDDQKEQLGDTFLRYISYNYSKRFFNIKDLNFKVLSDEELQNKIIIVKTNLLIMDDEPLKISYICSKRNKLLFDVLLKDSISEISTKKSEFKSTINKNGASGLIEAINKFIKLTD